MRVEECACGGLIRVQGDDVRQAVHEHNGGSCHALWRALRDGRENVRSERELESTRTTLIPKGIIFR